MLSDQYVFTQLMTFLPKHEFRSCVQRSRGDRRIRNFSCLDQFLCMAFAQLTYRDSLRDIETCLRAIQSKLYHLGIRGKVSRSTLADANESARLADLQRFRPSPDPPRTAVVRRRQFWRGLGAYRLRGPDSTTIDLCLSLFPWAKFRRNKGAIKLHTLLDLRGNIPCFVLITDGKTSDVTVLDKLVIEPGTFYVKDRGYIDFARLHRFTRNMAFFVTRAKRNMDYSRRCDRPVDKSTGLRSDQTIILTGPKTSKAYPVPFAASAFAIPKQRKGLFF